MIDIGDSENPNVSPLPKEGEAVAIAIKGDDTPGSPGHIVASGRGKLAQEILALAFAKGIKVREDAELAQMLVKLDVESPIPTEAIMAVAEILSRVYEANARLDTPSTEKPPAI
ncbi:MAG: EscU/YscU/HrcU family type III secretion system export apparatus switch protein [Alphaproteobacteria bacterium]|nr:EscU/YscU/HrcU family type III secretion system export apparatus switch protein [Alphaproteobacteria bacterium]